MGTKRVHAAGLRDALAVHWWAFAARGAMALAFGLVVLLLPGFGRLLLVQMFTVQLLAGGALVLVALRRVPWRRGWRPDPFRAEAMLGVAMGVALGDLALHVKAVLMPAIAAWMVFGGALALAGAALLDAHHGRAWLALGGTVSVISGSVLGAVFAALILHSDAGALFLGADAAVHGPNAAVLTAWFPTYAILSGVSQLALALRLFMAAPSWSAGLRLEALALTAGAFAVVLGCLHYGYAVLAGVALLVLGLAPVLRAAAPCRRVIQGAEALRTPRPSIPPPSGRGLARGMPHAPGRQRPPSARLRHGRAIGRAGPDKARRASQPCCGGRCSRHDHTQPQLSRCSRPSGSSATWAVWRQVVA